MMFFFHVGCNRNINPNTFNMTLFYSPTIFETSVLSEEESLHCAKVLRMNAGEEVLIVDGKGGKYRAKILVPHPKRTVVELLDRQEVTTGRTASVHIAIAPTKNMDRLEWFAEKTTEIGIDEITPVFCRFSERKSINLERMEKILVSAMKQSQKAHLPKLNPACQVQQFIKQADEQQKFIAHCYDEKKQLLQRLYEKTTSALVMIGPEGDFSQEEVSLSIDNGFQPVSLGESRLRTETAGVVACHTMNLIMTL
jgi:16S rRNA (uracil1498-N3)-methyltransferase